MLRPLGSHGKGDELATCSCNDNHSSRAAVWRCAASQAFLASANERSRHSGGNDSMRRELADEARPCPLLPSPGCVQAISLGYVSLGQQREVTRAPAGGRKPAAGEPGHQARSLGKVIQAQASDPKPATLQKFPAIAGSQGRENCRAATRLKPQVDHAAAPPTHTTPASGKC